MKGFDDSNTDRSPRAQGTSVSVGKRRRLCSLCGEIRTARSDLLSACFKKNGMIRKDAAKKGDKL